MKKNGVCLQVLLVDILVTDPVNCLFLFAIFPNIESVYCKMCGQIISSFRWDNLTKHFAKNWHNIRCYGNKWSWAMAHYTAEVLNTFCTPAPPHYQHSSITPSQLSTPCCTWSWANAHLTAEVRNLVERTYLRPGLIAIEIPIADSMEPDIRQSNCLSVQQYQHFKL